MCDWLVKNHQLKKHSLTPVSIFAAECAALLIRFQFLPRYSSSKEIVRKLGIKQCLMHSTLFFQNSKAGAAAAARLFRNRANCTFLNLANNISGICNCVHTHAHTWHGRQTHSNAIREGGTIISLLRYRLKPKWCCKAEAGRTDATVGWTICNLFGERGDASDTHT